MNRLVRCAAATCALVALAPGQVCAQFPASAVTLVVAAPAGDESDVSARLIAAKLTERWGRAVFVENKPGDSGVAGAEFVAKAKPDGHVLLMGNVLTHAILPALRKKISYDADRAFAPVSLVAEVPLVLLVHPSIKAQAPRDLVAAAKPKASPLKYASAGNGSLTHLAAALFESTARVQFAHSPQKGDAQALSEVVAGRATLAFAPLPDAIGQISGAKLRPLAVTSAQRAAALPKLQTVAESGFPGYEATEWFGVLAPAGTPAAAIEKIARDVQRAATAADVRSKLEQKGAITVGSTPAQFKARIEADRQRYARVIEEQKIRPD